jgi:hypothetical protein
MVAVVQAYCGEGAVGVFCIYPQNPCNRAVNGSADFGAKGTIGGDRSL